MQKKDNKLTRVAQIILQTFEKEDNRAMKPEELVEIIGMKIRSVRYGLKLLLEQNLVAKYPDLRDLRSFYYTPITNEINSGVAVSALA